MFFSTPLEVARKLPEEVLRRAGWEKAGGGCGFVAHEDPIKFIDRVDGMSDGAVKAF